jgi:hypothetical protein
MDTNTPVDNNTNAPVENTPTEPQPENVDKDVEQGDVSSGTAEDVQTTEPNTPVDKTGTINKVTPVKITDDFVNPNSPRTTEAATLVNTATQTLQAVPDTIRRPDEVAREQTDNAGKTETKEPVNGTPTSEVK